jgi:DNA modification methylase
MKIIKRNINELSQDPANARKHDERNIESIVASLRRFGQQKPIVIDSSGVVRAGNGTLEAARQLGWESIECVETSLKSSDAISYAIADNRTAELAEWDDEVLAAQLNGLLADDPELMEVAGFTEEELAALLADSEMEPEVIEDEVPEPPVDPITKPGDLWILGDHRLLCGDSTKAEDVARLMSGVKADIMFTDPPYGVNYEGGHFHSGDVNIKRKREKLSADSTTQIYNDFLPIALAVVDGPCYMWFAGSKARDVYNAVHDNECEVHALIIWHKTNATYAAMNAQYKQRHEPCLYFKPRGSTLRWCGETTEATVWNQDRDGINEFHPTQKPVALAAKALKNHEAATVLDMFCGSGSTLIAAEQLGRKCYGMEISSQYVDVICNRWAKLTNESPVLEETGETFDQVAKRRRGNE